MQKEYLECGKIVTTHGIKGEVKIEPWCDDPQWLAEEKSLGLGSPANTIAVESGRTHKGMVLLKLFGIDTVESSAALRGKVLFVHRDRIPMEPGEHFIQDLVGLSVIDVDTCAVYGTLTDVSKTGANDVYHIRFPDGVERLIPAIPQVVISVDLAAGEMRIRPLEGLFE